MTADQRLFFSEVRIVAGDYGMLGGPAATYLSFEPVYPTSSRAEGAVAQDVTSLLDPFFEDSRFVELQSFGLMVPWMRSSSASV